MQKNALSQSAKSYSGRVLIAEDEPDIADTLIYYLKSAGYGVTYAKDGLEAWNILSADNDYEIVITDKRMPNMDGLALAARIKADPRLTQIPVIMQTGDVAQEELTRGINAGVFYYLPKPYEEETLLAIVRSAVNDRNRKELFIGRLKSNNLALKACVNAEFHFSTFAQAQDLALLLGAAFPKPDLATNGLYELLINAIEHGNLGLGYTQKANHLAENTYETEIAKLSAMDSNAGKKVILQFTRNEQRVQVLITDEGKGFDWRHYLEIEPARAAMGHGRGIAKANLLCFDKIEYLGTGNQVRLTSLL